MFCPGGFKILCEFFLFFFSVLFSLYLVLHGLFFVPPPPLGFGAHIITLSEQLRQGEVIA